MKAEGQTLYKDSSELITLLYQCVPMMSKVNRITYLNSARIEAKLMLSLFVLAYSTKEYQYACYLAFEAVTNVVFDDVRRIINYGLLTSANPSNGKKVDTMKKDLLECIGRIDTGLGRWKTSVIKKRS